LICRMNKSLDRKGKVIFIDAVNLVEKSGTESYLTEEHISMISDAYENFQQKDYFSAVVANEDILNANGSLSISMYVKKEQYELQEEHDIEELVNDWMDFSSLLNHEYDKLTRLVKDNES